MSREQTSAMKGSGIYLILQLSSGKHYVGSASCFATRFSTHKSELNSNTHCNQKLQRAWNKHGSDDFKFMVIEECDKSILIEREQFWLDQTLPFFNILRKARSAAGYRHSEEVKRKLSELAKSRYESLTEDEKRARAKSHAEKLRGKTASEDTKRKMSESHKMRPPNENSIRNLIDSRQLDPNYYLKAADARAKTYYLVTSPEGNKQIVRNLSSFCRELNLYQQHMIAVAKGKRNNHKGWMCRYAYESEAPALPQR